MASPVGIWYLMGTLVCLSWGLNVDYILSKDLSPEDRVPFFAPDKCKDPNQMLYPTENDTWTCDCGLGYIYYKPKDACFAPYREGPCSKGNHLIYNKSSRISECLKNPCKDGYAQFKGVCYELGKPKGPCKIDKNGAKIFDVNSTTLEVGCLGGTEVLSIIHAPVNCGIGTKADTVGACQLKWR